MQRSFLGRWGRRRGLLIRRAFLAAAVLLWAAAARAQTLTVNLAPSQAPLVNAMTVGMDSTLVLDVSHDDAGRAYYRVDVQLPTSRYAIVDGSTGPTGWVASKTQTVLGVPVIRFAAQCSNTAAGIAAGKTARFTIKLKVPNSSQGPAPVDFDSSAFTVTASTGSSSTGNGGSCATGSKSRTLTNSKRTAPIKVLGVTGAGTALQQLAPPAVVVWTITNQASEAKTNVTVSPIAAGQSCGASLSLAAYPGSGGSNAGKVRCAYAVGGAGSYTYATNATGSGRTAGAATAVGATAGPIDVGAATVRWPRSTLVRGRVRDPVTIVVSNASRATISQVDVTTASSGWSLSAAESSSAGLLYSPASSAGANVVFTGSISPGDTVTLTLRYSAVPAGAGPFPFQVKLTPTSGSDYAVSFAQNVTVQTVTFPPDVSGLTVHSNVAGQTLAWTNPSSGHAGVVVFRAVPPAVPAPPIDYVDYAATPGGGAVYANRTDPKLRAAPDLTPGTFNYLVCNHDASLVYSECNTESSAKVGYLGNSAVAPAGGWTDQLGGEALGQLQMYAAGRAAVPTTRGDVSVVDLHDGSRPLDKAGVPIAPVAVTAALPATYMPSWRLGNGTLVAVAADQGGRVTAIDLETGSKYWEVQLEGESFTAGVSGVSSTGGSAAFKTAYPGRDLVFLGSSTTGRVYAIDLDNKAVLWSVKATTVEPGSTVEIGTTVDALTTYDPVTNYLWVPTAAGVEAFDLAPSGPNASTPARRAWSANLGPHTMYCVRTTVPALMACIGNDGILRVLDKLTGDVRSTIATGATLPSTLVRVASGTPGFLVGNARGLVRVAADASLSSLKIAGTWPASPNSGWTVSPALLFSASGYVIVGASDLTAQGVHLYKCSSEDLHDMGRSPDTVHPANPRTLIGPPSYDSSNGLYFFGTEEGRVWAIPSF